MSRPQQGCTKVKMMHRLASCLIIGVAQPVNATQCVRLKSNAYGLGAKARIFSVELHRKPGMKRHHELALIAAVAWRRRAPDQR